MKYQFIKDNRLAFAVKKMSLILEVSKSGYYKWHNKQPGSRAQENIMLLNRIKDVFNEHKGCYGSPRITRQLKNNGIPCGKNRIARIMQKNSIWAKTKKRFKITTNSRHKNPIAPNLLNQEFRINKINRAWVSDITYIYTREGWLYLSGILDLCSKKIVGWSMSERLTHKLVTKALEQAMLRRDIKDVLILHSDRGSQYASHDYTHLLAENNFIQSMSSAGNCYDNAVMESFFKTLKTELVYWQDYKTRNDAKKSIFEYIEIYYNRKRMHSSIGYMSPEEFENSMNYS
jgi:transposase InsO family protein